MRLSGDSSDHSLLMVMPNIRDHIMVHDQLSSLKHQQQHLSQPTNPQTRLKNTTCQRGVLTHVDKVGLV
jgi:hypothetical protein